MVVVKSHLTELIKMLKVEDITHIGYICDNCDWRAVKRIYDLVDEGDNRFSQFTKLKLCSKCIAELKQQL